MLILPLRLKKVIVYLKITIGLLVSYLPCPKYMKNYCMNKYINISTTYSPNIYVVLGNYTVLNIVYSLEILKKALDNGLYSGIVLTDLSKAFDSISHDLLIAKLYAYGLSNQSLNIISNYLSGRKQRTKINDKFSTWHDIIYEVPQGSVLGPLFFNIYINDLFFFSDAFSIANYADDCSPYTFSGTIEDVIYNLEAHSRTLIKRYENNYLQPILISGI